MGKKASTEMKKRKRKKGRPSLTDLKTPNFHRRSTRRNPTAGEKSPSPEFIDDDDDERREKKVKLVVRLPHFDNRNENENESLSQNESSYGSDEENDEKLYKKRKIDDRSDEGEKVSKAMDTPQGLTIDSGPTTPLPDKKLLVFILDRLQKKDTYGVFSEPVDPNELPDYHEIIERPMDFGTVRTKLDAGAYSCLEELEADVFLICSNAMQYNSSDTVYYRQARSIQELAKRDFENLRQEGEDGELQPKVVRRGRPPSKNLKKPLSRSSVDRVGPELSSGATLATPEDNTTESNTYNLRRGPMSYKFQSTDGTLTSQRSRNGEHYSEWLTDWNDEFPAYILKADLKYGKKQFSLDETRRHTYKQFHPSACAPESSGLSNFGGDMKQLTPVGLHFEHGYARSLARFAANLGPVVWKIASKKFQSIVPPGVKFDPSFLLRENVLPQLPPPSLSSEKQKSQHPNRPTEEEAIETDRRFHHHKNSQNIRNGFNGVLGYSNLPSQTGQSEMVQRSETNTPSTHSEPTKHIESDEGHSGNLRADEGHFGKQSSQLLLKQQRHNSVQVPPDLNVGLQAVGSPQHPDLVLQL